MQGITAYQSVTNVRARGSADITSTLKLSYKATETISSINICQEEGITSALMGKVGAVKFAGCTTCFERANVKPMEHAINVIETKIYLTMSGHRLYAEASLEMVGIREVIFMMADQVDHRNEGP